MSSAKLKEDLNNCLITFDRRVVLTELLDNYELPYEELNQVIVEHLKQQENKFKLKYDKRFLVHGVQMDEGENKKEIFKIVEERKLKEWLQKLQNAESSLYSIEVAGSAKSAAPVFKPLKIREDVKLKERKSTKSSENNGEVAPTTKEKIKEIKKETKNPFQESPANKSIKESPKSANKAVTPVKKTPPNVESSPASKKSADKKAATIKKGGIGNFFAPAAAKKTDVQPKESKSILKPPTPKKMEDFFKKQTEKPTTTAESFKKSASNKNNSIQLFGSEDEEEKDEVDEVSSDEEEKIAALKRDIISSDVEMDADEEETDKPSTSAKRRRILDSEDEDEDPPIKQEKLDIKEEEIEAEEVAEPETYLDEEGFVITKKPKQKSTATKSATAAAIKTSPAVTLKTSPKESKKSSSTSKDKKSAGNAVAKTKQADIKSFFSKK